MNFFWLNKSELVSTEKFSFLNSLHSLWYLLIIFFIENQENFLSSLSWFLVSFSLSRVHMNMADIHQSTGFYINNPLMLSSNYINLFQCWKFPLLCIIQFLLKLAEQLLRCQALIPFNCNAFLSFDYFTGWTGLWVARKW